MYFVYILRSESTGRHYIGCTNDLSRRLKEHNTNKTKSLSKKGPFSIVYKEEYSELNEALRREKAIKSYKGGRAFKRLVNGC